jgi:hypothetical protein
VCFIGFSFFLFFGPEDQVFLPNSDFQTAPSQPFKPIISICSLILTFFRLFPRIGPSSFSSGDLNEDGYGRGMSQAENIGGMI